MQVREPLRTWDTMCGYIRGTTTTTGLEVRAFLQEGVYETGQSVSDADMHMLKLERHAICPNWNYTIHPRRPEALGLSVEPIIRMLFFNRPLYFAEIATGLGLALTDLCVVHGYTATHPQGCGLRTQ